MTRLVIIGGGRMGSALLGGLLKSGWATVDELCVVEADASQRAALAGEHAGLTVTDGPVDADGVLIAVKPDAVPAVCESLRDRQVSRVLSIAAGVTTSTIEGMLGAATPVVRAMPNTPALVGAGASAIAPGSAATDDDLHWAGAILGSVGEVVRVDEAALDAVTGLSGSGPAYVYLVAEALIDAGVGVGLDREIAEALALQTVLGAARMLTETGRTPVELRAEVTSPGGTTAAGIASLEAEGLRAILAAGVRAATERSVELGNSATKL